MSKWAPLGKQYCEDYQATLPIVCDLLSTVPSQHVHPLLVNAFGEMICFRADREATDEYFRQILILCRTIPLDLDVYEDTCIPLLAKNLAHNPYIPVYYYLSLIGNTKAYLVWKESNKRITHYDTDYEALRDIVSELPVEKRQTDFLCVALKLVEWEWKERCLRVLRILDFPFKMKGARIRATWCCCAVGNQQWRETFLRRLTVRIGLKLRRLIVRVQDAPFDLAVFLFMVKELESALPKDVQEQSWFKRFVDYLKLDESLTKDVDQVIRWILMIQSQFGLSSFIGNFPFTQRQWDLLARIQRKPWITAAEDAVEWIVLRSTTYA